MIETVTTKTEMTTEARAATARPLDRVVPAASQLEGEGFEVYRPFPSRALNRLDPFLLLDEMAPSYHSPGGKPVGAPPHPHRGFETVTYVLQGEVEHRDSAGNHGIIGPGDVQWMTAGDGIVHSEMPSARIQTEGGTGHGLQLWINLPGQLRRTQPKYQALTAGEIATASGEGWAADVVAGSMFGTEGPADTHTPVGIAHLTMDAGAELRVPVADGFTAAVYAVAGDVNVGADPQRVTAQHLAVFDRSTGDIVLSVPADAASAFEGFVLTGEPIGEPIARYGPFVMNTAAEIDEAIADFNAGRMGTIPATGNT